jgi:hypothetical protein
MKLEGILAEPVSKLGVNKVRSSPNRFFAFNWQRQSPIIQLGLYFKNVMNK